MSSYMSTTWQVGLPLPVQARSTVIKVLSAHLFLSLPDESLMMYILYYCRQINTNSQADISATLPFPIIKNEVEASCDRCYAHEKTKSILMKNERTVQSSSWFQNRTLSAIRSNWNEITLLIFLILSFNNHVSFRTCQSRSRFSRELHTPKTYDWQAGARVSCFHRRIRHSGVQVGLKVNRMV